MFRLILIFIVAMVIATVAFGQENVENTLNFPPNYLPEDFIYEVVEEAPALPNTNTVNPVTINVNDLPRTGDTILPAGTTPANNSGIFNQSFNSESGTQFPTEPRLTPNTLPTTQETPENTTAQTTAQPVPLFGARPVSLTDVPRAPALTLPLASAPTFIPPSAIATEEIGFNPDKANNFGLLDTTNTGFSNTLWQGLTAKRAEELLTPLTTQSISNTWAQNTLYRLLLTRATAPTEAATNTSWLSKRAQYLTSLGQSEAAYNLIRQVKPTQLSTDPQLAETWVSTHLLAGKTAKACPVVSNQVKNNDANFWQQHLILCQLLQNETQKLNLSLSVLDVKSATQNSDFYTLLNATQEASPTAALTKNNTTPNYLNTPEATLLATFPSLYRTVSASTAIQNLTLTRIVKSNNLPLELRLQAAESLAKNTPSRLNIEQLKTLYKTAQFTPQQATDPLGSAKEIASRSQARALLFQASQLAPAISLRASAQNELYTSLKQDNLEALAPDFTANLSLIQPTPELAWLAPKMIRYALRKQDISHAQAWLTALQQNTTLSPELSAERTQLTLALAIYNQGSITTPLSNWLSAQNAEESLKIQQILSSIDALGLSVPSEIWQSVAGQLTGIENTTTGTGPLWLRLVADALQNDRQAEVLLLLLQPLKNTKISQLAPLTLANIITALGYLDMQNEARDLTLQILLGEF